ncbi:Release factor glutamine methyltransferase [Flavobacterium columnare]|uniref:Release factor glutamine methyltransferase n=2 Tax=Flavobacterium TaxID=237 RepID=A0ABW8PL58_9FLAO|nr:peptide chain release factor N(5)-glutamine methyltransferase [Flavobacterium columnare]SPE77025.1 Release factor glutamine methyltransferase [Flavobacterium columnare]
MLLKEYKIQFVEELLKTYDEKEIESFFCLLLEAFHGMKRIDFALNPYLELDALQLLQWETVLGQLKQEKPIQYILGETDFFGMSFYVNEHTLIPRPETEELVNWIIQKVSIVKKDAKIRILDIGTGTGCIAISLAKNIPMAEVYAMDVSLKVLEVARRNARRNNVAIEFIHQDVLTLEKLDFTFDIIVSNPPYVRNSEKVEIKKNVLNYEPHLALFVKDEDALIFYRKIAQLALISLNEEGCLFFEINQYLGKDMMVLMEELQFENINLRKDLYGNDRMLLGQKASFF